MTEKSIEEKYFNEVSKSLQDQDVSSLDILLEKEPEEVDKELPLEEEIDLGSVEDPVTEEEDLTLDDDDEGAEKDKAPVKNKEDELSVVDALKKQLEEAKTVEHKLKSDAGRVPSLQRKLAELDRKLADISANPNKTKDASGNDAPAFTLKSDAMEALKLSDPELAKAIEDSIAAAYGAIKSESANNTREITNTFMESAKEDFYSVEWNKLTEQVPNAAAVFHTPEWKQWRDSQTPGVRALADSDYSDDVVLALKMFSGMSVGAPARSEASSKITEAREHRLKAVTPASGSKGPSPKTRHTEESLFSKIYTDMINQNKRR